MFTFHKSLNASQITKRCGAFFFRKAHNPDKALNDLDSYLKDLGDEPIKLLTDAVQSWSKFSCDELTAAIENGRLDELFDWQSRWAKVINELLAPLWTKAVIAAAKNYTGGKMIFSDSNEFVRAWVDTHGGELISLLSDESRKAITNVVLRGQALEYSPRQISAEVRPLLGLTDRQAQANLKYKDVVYRKLLENQMNEAKARERSAAAALKYAGKQRHYRAETIVITEIAHAYNNGAHIGVQRAVSNGLMGRCEMIWTTAGTNRVCKRCMELKDTVVGHTDESGVKLPPLHPRCRCIIMYREIEPPKPPTNSLNDEKITLNINDFGEAHIPMAKLTKYALDSEKAPDKAFAFEKALGYNLGNVDKLVENIKRNVNNYELIEKPTNNYGRRFQQVMELTGENGKTANVLLAWFLDKNTNEFRLTSIYVDKK